MERHADRRTCDRQQRHSCFRAVGEDTHDAIPTADTRASQHRAGRIETPSQHLVGERLSIRTDDRDRVVGLRGNDVDQRLGHAARHP